MNALLPIDVPRRPLLDGTWKLALRGPSGVQGALRALARPVLEAWIDLGARGGYTASETRSGEAALQPMSSLDAFDQGNALVLRSRALDPRAFNVLRSALLYQSAQRLFEGESTVRVTDEQRALELVRRFGDAALHVEMHPSDGGEIARLPGADPANAIDDLDLYPIGIAQPPFDLVIAPQAGRLHRCIVLFGARVDAPLLGELALHVGSWARLLEGGGFEQPSASPGTRSSSFGTVQLFESDSAEIVVDRFDANDGAWRMLINALATFAVTHRLVAVEIN